MKWFDKLPFYATAAFSGFVGLCLLFQSEWDWLFQRDTAAIKEAFGAIGVWMLGAAALIPLMLLDRLLRQQD